MKYILTVIFFLFLVTSIDAQIIPNKEYGKACGQMKILADRPQLGKEFRVWMITNERWLYGRTGWIGLGFNPTHHHIHTLPHGACTMYIVPRWIYPIKIDINNGVGQLKLFTVPNDTGMLGLSFYVQGAYVSFLYENWWSSAFKCVVSK